jgi:hypothetical protein
MVFIAAPRYQALRNRGRSKAEEHLLVKCKLSTHRREYISTYTCASSEITKTSICTIRFGYLLEKEDATTDGTEKPHYAEEKNSVPLPRLNLRG